MLLELDRVTKKFGSVVVADELSLAIEQGDILLECVQRTFPMGVVVGCEFPAGISIHAKHRMRAERRVNLGRPSVMGSRFRSKGWLIKSAAPDKTAK